MFWFGEAAKVFISTVEISATFLLALSIYRFPLRYAYGKVALICFIISVLGTVMRDWAHIYEYTTVSMVITSFVLTMLVLQLPAFFSMIISFTSLLSAIILELGVSVLGSHTGLGNVISIIDSVKLYFIQDTAVAIINIICVVILQKYKIGFTFILRSMASNKNFKKYNYIIAFLLIGFVTIMQLSFLTIMPYDTTSKFTLFKICFSLLYFIIFAVFIIVAFRKNRLEITHRYSYLDRKSSWNEKST